MRRVLWLIPLLLSAAEAPPKPKPLTAEQRVKVLAAAVATQMAELNLHRLDSQYREMRGKLQAALDEKARAENALVTTLQESSGAKGCSLNPSAEWVCKPPAAK